MRLNMLRLPLLSSVLVFPALLRAQTVSTVQNGAWTAPSTWDCACVPDYSQSLVIMHSVEILDALLIGHQQVQVMSTGEITMSFPGTISFNTVLLNEGHVLVMGDILNEGLFNNNGFAEVVGTFINDGSLISDAGALLRIEGDFVNQDLVQGEGAICVTDITDNQGTISGTLDLCDQTPTVNIAPFVDANTGVIESGITYCQNSPCATSVQEGSTVSMELFPVLASDQVTLVAVPVGASVLLLDHLGRLMRPMRTAVVDRMDLDLSGLTAGAYRAVVRGSVDQRVLPFVISR